MLAVLYPRVSDSPMVHDTQLGYWTLRYSTAMFSCLSLLTLSCTLHSPARPHPRRRPPTRQIHLLLRLLCKLNPLTPLSASKRRVIDLPRLQSRPAMHLVVARACSSTKANSHSTPPRKSVRTSANSRALKPSNQSGNTLRFLALVVVFPSFLDPCAAHLGQGNFGSARCAARELWRPARPSLKNLF